MLELFLLATVTALATGVGALPVYWLGSRALGLRPAMWGVVIGVLGVASVQGLLIPGLKESDDAGVLGGLAAGVLFLLVARTFLDHHEVQLGTASGITARRGVLVFLVLFVHSLPEGFALGSAWASHTSGLGLFVFLAIAIQNVPEGTAAAIPMRDASVSLPRAFWAATLTSAPQPPGALIAFGLVEATRSLLGPSFGFAAGAMLALVVVEVVPAALSSAKPASAVRAAVVSGVLMVVLGSVLEVG
jgi:ZIP family zinc transporter